MWSSKIVAVITQDVASAIIALFMSTIAYYHRSQTSQYPLCNTYKYTIPDYWALSVLGQHAPSFIVPVCIQIRIELKNTLRVTLIGPLVSITTNNLIFA